MTRPPSRTYDSRRFLNVVSHEQPRPNTAPVSRLAMSGSRNMQAEILAPSVGRTNSKFTGTGFKNDTSDFQGGSTVIHASEAHAMHSPC